MRGNLKSEISGTSRNPLIPPLYRRIARGDRRPARRRGATLVEMLIGLAIAAALLTAVAFAMDASTRGYQINQQQSDLTQRARLGLHRMLSTIRAGDGHEPIGANPKLDFAAGYAVDDTGLSMDSDDGVYTVYRYDAANKRIIAQVGSATHVLLEGVERFTVRLEPMRSAAHVKAGQDYDLLRRATILLTIRDPNATPLPGESRDKDTLTISSSAMPRRNAW